MTTIENPTTLPSVSATGASLAVVGARKPFIKWVGGKGRLLKHIMPHVPAGFSNYHEPFVGGGAMYFAVQDRVTNRSYVTDLNEDLINAWVAVKNHAEELKEALTVYAAKDSKEFYLSVRPLQPDSLVERAARFIYLNQTSWNGLWRVNKWGGFNVPWGDRPFRGIGDDTLSALEVTLSRTVIRHGDFRDALARPKKGDFVYLDPPYLPISDTSKFHLYTEKRFRYPDLVELSGLCAELSDRGVNWIMSNRDTPTIRELFADSDIRGLTTNRSVAAQNQRDVERRDSPEVIVIGKVA